MKNKEKLIRYGEDYLRDLTSGCCTIEDLHKEFVWEAVKALKQVQKIGAIRDNATNGDVIKAVFGCGALFCDCDTDYESVIAYGLDKTPTCEGTLFTAKWWNAPYKAENEDKE
ncbi:MAG: hypothetical protein K5659_09050 [Lachnospiraceae bacterium]|nr:hypothetical protein [Lachnospiraceae bacterium]